MRVLVRADASVAIGSGHVVRTTTLADALRDKGHDVIFVCRDHPGNRIDNLRQCGFEVRALPVSDGFCAGATYESWVGASQEDDATQTILAVGAFQPHWVIVDHYGLGAPWETALRSKAENIMVIDDLANRPHDCDLLLDQNFRGSSQNPYSNIVPANCRFLLGPRFALLKPDYARVRQRFTRKQGDVERVLVFFGGGNNRKLIEITMEALCSPSLEHLHVDLVLGQEAEDATFGKWGVRQGEVKIHRDLPHLADLMAAADLAIGAGGSTTWERMCMGLPSIVVSTADNQVETCETMHRLGAIDYVGTASSITSEIMQMCVEQATFLENPPDTDLGASIFVDGLGCARIVEVLSPTPPTDLCLRSARRDDLLLYFNWANDPDARRNSLLPDQIKIDTHTSWFKARMISLTSHLLVLEAGGLPIGQIRFEQANGTAWISYSLDPISRGRGLAVHLVASGIEAMSTLGINHFSATVKADNAASLSVFRKLGFAESEDEAGTMKFEGLSGNIRPAGQKPIIWRDS